MAFILLRSIMFGIVVFITTLYTCELAVNIIRGALVRSRL
jgi:hypothetical protein